MLSETLLISELKWFWLCYRSARTHGLISVASWPEIWPTEWPTGTIAPTWRPSRSCWVTPTTSACPTWLALTVAATSVTWQHRWETGTVRGRFSSSWQVRKSNTSPPTPPHIREDWCPSVFRLSWEWRGDGHEWQLHGHISHLCAHLCPFCVWNQLRKWPKMELVTSQGSVWMCALFMPLSDCAWLLGLLKKYHQRKKQNQAEVTGGNAQTSGSKGLNVDL